MTFTGKIRGYLILIAFIPPVLMMSVIYFHSIKQLEITEKKTGYHNLQKFNRFHDAFKKELRLKTEKLARTPSMKKAILFAKSKRPYKINISDIQTELDFLEILDDSGKVLASHHRRGLIGQLINKNFGMDKIPNADYLETEEYDLEGRHAAFTYIFPVDSGTILYIGKYIDTGYLDMVKEIISADLKLFFHDNIGSRNMPYENMRRNQLYQTGERLTALLTGGDADGFSLIAEFKPAVEKPLFYTLLEVAGAVAFFSVLLAIALGWYITGRVKREIDNLIRASSQVAAGDLTTPVMAYEEGEFAQLADSFSDMKSKLKQMQNKLVTTEKIAAWKAVGQKIAHEVKNPLTPIAISIDDLKRSYHEKLPDFDRTLDETTSVIKTEIDRLTKLLDQFVNFARMAPPVVDDVKPEDLIDDIKILYKNEVETKRLQIVNASGQKTFRIDHERIKQLLINLIKNGFESSDNAEVKIEFSDTDEGVRILIEDNGPGFPVDILKSDFGPYVSTKQEGSGLGLIICQRIIFDSGGTIELYNREEGGAGLIINLPFDNG